MRYKYDLHNLRKDIEHTVRNAVRLEDVQHLKGSIDDIISELSQVGRDLTTPRAGTPPPPPPPRVRTPHVHAPRPRREKTIVYNSSPPAPVKMRSINGIVLTILGVIAAGYTTLLGVMLIAVFTSWQTTIALASDYIAFALCSILFSLGLGTSSFMLIKGSSLRKRVKRYPEYIRLFTGCKLYPVEQLAIVFDCSKSSVVRDLRGLISTGKLPGAYLDADKTCVILDEETYRQYLMAEQKSRMLSKNGRKKTVVMPQSQPEPASAPQPAEASPVDAIIVEGRAYINRISATNPIIKNQEVSHKIDQIEATVSKIFDYVSQHPEKQGDLRKLMSYYLPTTLKLLEAYSKFEAHAVRGENVSTAMHEIENALQTINLAFENLLDDLFEHEMYDITSDISALETMLAQEGLTAQAFANVDDKNAAGGLQ